MLPQSARALAKRNTANTKITRSRASFRHFVHSNVYFIIMCFRESRRDEHDCFIISSSAVMFSKNNSTHTAPSQKHTFPGFRLDTRQFFFSSVLFYLPFPLGWNTLKKRGRNTKGKRRQRDRENCSHLHFGVQ